MKSSFFSQSIPPFFFSSLIFQSTLNFFFLLVFKGPLVFSLSLFFLFLPSFLSILFVFFVLGFFFPPSSLFALSFYFHPLIFKIVFRFGFHGCISLARAFPFPPPFVPQSSFPSVVLVVFKVFFLVFYLLFFFLCSVGFCSYAASLVLSCGILLNSCPSWSFGYFYEFEFNLSLTWCPLFHTCLSLTRHQKHFQVFQIFVLVGEEVLLNPLKALPFFC